MHYYYGISNKYHDTKWVVVSVMYHISISTHFWPRVSISAYLSPPALSIILNKNYNFKIAQREVW